MDFNKDHLKIWEAVEKTPTTATKDANVGGQKITSIDSLHMVKLATKIFGPVGIGWGYRIDVDRFDKGAPVLLKETVIGHELTHTCQLTLWYEWEGKKAQITHFGHTRAVYMTNAGKFITDGEAPKKSVTDAIKKCLSQLGFSADIFSGLFDNKDYVEQRKAETQLEQSEDFDAQLKKNRDEFNAWIQRECDTLRTKIPHPKSISMATQQVLDRLSGKASIARLDQEAIDKAGKMISKAGQEGVDRAIEAKKKANEQKQEITNG